MHFQEIAGLKSRKEITSVSEFSTKKVISQPKQVGLDSYYPLPIS